MVNEDRAPSGGAALRAEVDLLRGAVAALRATREAAVSAAKKDARVSATRICASTTLGAFLLGVATTVFALLVYQVGLCP
jgi:hypothetical protein